MVSLHTSDWRACFRSASLSLWQRASPSFAMQAQILTKHERSRYWQCRGFKFHHNITRTRSICPHWISIEKAIAALPKVTWRRQRLQFHLCHIQCCDKPVVASQQHRISITTLIYFLLIFSWQAFITFLITNLWMMGPIFFNHIIWHWNTALLTLRNSALKTVIYIWEPICSPINNSGITC